MKNFNYKTILMGVAFVVATLFVTYEFTIPNEIEEEVSQMIEHLSDSGYSNPEYVKMDAKSMEATFLCGSETVVLEYHGEGDYKVKD